MPTLTSRQSVAPTSNPSPPPDREVRAQADARQRDLTKPAGSLGRLEALAGWASACQGVCPPHAFARPRVVVFAGDHGIARNGVSAYPPEVTAQMVANFLGGAARQSTSSPRLPAPRYASSTSQWTAIPIRPSRTTRCAGLPGPSTAKTPCRTRKPFRPSPPAERSRTRKSTGGRRSSHRRRHGHRQYDARNRTHRRTHGQ